MKPLKLLMLFTVSLSLLLIFSSCKNLTGESGELTETLDPIENVTPISGAENSTITVNRTSDSYFRLGFTNVQSNGIVSDGMVGEGWCIDWQKPIDSNNGTYENIQLYSTFNVESWNPTNYLFNIVDDLKNADSELTLYDIQAVVWSLRGFPKFNLDQIAAEDLPARMLTDGEPNFSYEKVRTILEIVEAGHEQFDFTEGTRYAVIAETPPDVQTVITVVN